MVLASIYGSKALYAYGSAGSSCLVSIPVEESSEDANIFVLANAEKEAKAPIKFLRLDFI
jgi:hypothetical protein